MPGISRSRQSARSPSQRAPPEHAMSKLTTMNAHNQPFIDEILSSLLISGGCPLSKLYKEIWRATCAASFARAGLEPPERRFVFHERRLLFIALSARRRESRFLFHRRRDKTKRNIQIPGNSARDRARALHREGSSAEGTRCTSQHAASRRVLWMLLSFGLGEGSGERGHPFTR